MRFLLVAFLAVALSGVAQAQMFPMNDIFAQFSQILTRLNDRLAPRPEPKAMESDDDGIDTRNAKEIMDKLDTLLGKDKEDKKKPAPEVAPPPPAPMPEVVYVDKPVYIPVYQQPPPVHHRPMHGKPC